MRRLLVLFIALAVSSCNQQQNKSNNKVEAEKNKIQKPVLNTKTANYLYAFAYECIDKEYPNKLGQVLGDSTYLKQPKELHPAFYGCFDWHSAVHGHWTLLNLVKNLPDFEHNKAILEKLNNNITNENIEVEIIYFKDVYNKNFERTYGWAWLLKIAETLRDWNSPEANKLNESLNPLVKLIEEKYIEFLPKLNYPIRVGEHTNTAFGLSFAYDYAQKYSPQLAQLIEQKAKEFYLEDKNCPVSWEPSGFDFLSPCLQEASLMLKILPKKEFKKWFDAFLPGFRKNPKKYFQPAEVTDRSDGKLAHLDGLNFSRAWCLYEIGYVLENQKIIDLANIHFNHSYKKMDSGEYAGTHWLASFALYAILKGN